MLSSPCAMRPSRARIAVMSQLETNTEHFFADFRRTGDVAATTFQVGILNKIVRPRPGPARRRRLADCYLSAGPSHRTHSISAGPVVSQSVLGNHRPFNDGDPYSQIRQSDLGFLPRDGRKSWESHSAKWHKSLIYGGADGTLRTLQVVESTSVLAGLAVAYLQEYPQKAISFGEPS
jgi:hypothetical protein